MSDTRGFTLVEVLIAALVLGFALGCSFYLFAKCSQAIEASTNTSVALNHAETVVEEMRARNDVSSVLGESWSTWAANEELNTLDNESVQVTYPSGTSAEPLEVLVSVEWEDDSGRSREDGRGVQLVTFLVDH